MSKIGFFDSGVGGLTVLEASRNLLPDLSFYYLGDTKHCPYGDRPLPEVRQFALNAVNHLSEVGCREVVMACNISSSIALEPAREQFPNLTFHGLINQDLVDEVASRSNNDTVGVLATTGTVNSGFYPKQLEPAGLEVVQQACSPLVPMIEAGHHQGPLVRQTLEPLLAPLERQGVDTVVLGCTHYPFHAPVIRELLDDEIEIVDPGQVMARRLRERNVMQSTDTTEQTFAASGEIESIKVTLQDDLGYDSVTVKDVTLEEAITS
jgi:glutamate racemase